MPPKVKVTKQDIVEAAVEIIRQHGTQGLNAREIASVLNCSTQPVFSNFATMDALNEAVMIRAEEICREHLQREVESGKYPPYKANGMAYIRFAHEEKELFKLLYMYDRKGVPPADSNLNQEMKSLVRHNTGMDEMNAQLFHLEMWAFVHGIATMFATGYLELDWELVSRMLTDAYQGLKKQYGME